MTIAATGRYASRLYANRRRAIDRSVPFWLPGEPGGQGRHDAGQGTFPSNPLESNDGQDGQEGRGTKNAPDDEAEEHKSHHPSEPPGMMPGAGICSHGPSFCPDRPDHPDPASNGAGLAGQGTTHPTLTALPIRPWTDDRAWISDIVWATTTDEKLATLFSWVLAAGGWIDGMTDELPPLLPRNQGRLAETELRRMLRQSGIATRDEPPS